MKYLHVSFILLSFKALNFALKKIHTKKKRHLKEEEEGNLRVYYGIE